jgi:hypothetical protein
MMKHLTKLAMLKSRILSMYCILLFSVFLPKVQAQWWTHGAQNFDGNLPTNTLPIEYYIVNPSTNCWQVGQPIKTHFTSAPSAPNALVTDTWNPYPTNTHSEFLVLYPDSFDFLSFPPSVWAFRWMQFLDMEDKKDFGMVHFTIDSGQTWENAFTSPKIYNFFGYNNQNIDTLPNGELGFTGIDTVGNSIWLCFRWSTFPLDSIKYLQFRFTFVSDSVDTGQDGWMIDNFELTPSVVHTLQKFEGQGLSMDVSPVPADDALYIKAPSLPELRDIDLLIIRNVEGKEMFRGEHLPPYYRIITREYPDGVYTISMQSGKYNETRVISVQHQR